MRTRPNLTSELKLSNPTCENHSMLSCSESWDFSQCVSHSSLGEHSPASSPPAHPSHAAVTGYRVCTVSGRTSAAAGHIPSQCRRIATLQRLTELHSTGYYTALQLDTIQHSNSTQYCKSSRYCKTTQYSKSTG